MEQLQIFAKRLRLARIKAKLSMQSLCDSMEGLVSKQAISKYESAKMMPDSTVLIALAKALAVSVDYFFRPFSFDTDNFKVSFRKKASASVKEIEALKAQIQDCVERYIEVEKLLMIVAPDLPSYSGKPIENDDDMVACAKKLRQEWNLGNDPISNVQDMLESHGIKVVLVDAPTEFDGVSGIVNKQHCFIVLNNCILNSERKRFTALHELAHLLYNKHFADSIGEKEREKLCHTFASEMLIPGAILLNLIPNLKRISVVSLANVGSVYGISPDALVFALHRLKVISDSRYKSYFINKSRNPELKAFLEKSNFVECTSNRFESLVYTALAQQLITSSKAASLLGVSLKEVINHSNSL